MTLKSTFLGLALSSLAVSGVLAQGGSFGPKAIYLRGSALGWSLKLQQQVQEVFDATKAVARKHKLRVVERDDANGVLRLSRGNQKGSTLDRHCTFPIVNYYSWQPLENFASAQNNALTRRRPGETLAQAGRLNGTVHVALRHLGDGVYQVQSVCSAFLHEWGPVEATSRGVLEAAFLSQLLVALGTPTEVPLPELPVLEPSRANPTRDLHLAQQCMEKCTPFHGCTGMYVDPQSLELRCVNTPEGDETDEQDR